MENQKITTVTYAKTVKKDSESTTRTLETGWNRKGSVPSVVARLKGQESGVKNALRRKEKGKE